MLSEKERQQIGDLAAGHRRDADLKALVVAQEGAVAVRRGSTAADRAKRRILILASLGICEQEVYGAGIEQLFL